MDFKYKYLKYKDKYLNLKNQYGGKKDTKYKIKNIDENKITLVKNDVNKLDYDHYNIIFNDKLKSNINIDIIYNIEKLIKIKISVNKIKVNKNNKVYILDFNIDVINKIEINLNNEKIELNNVNISEFTNKNFLNFNDANKNTRKTIDFCKMNYKNKNSKIQKLVNILTCDKIYKSFGDLDDEKCMKYGNLILFIYDVLSYDKVNNKDFEEYSNLIFKRESPVVLSNDDVKIQVGLNDYEKISKFTKDIKEYFIGFDKISILIDTGNSEYTMISEKFLKLLQEKYNDGVVVKDVYSLIGGLNGSSTITKQIAIFNVEVYDEKYNIIAVVSDNSPVDLIFGEKSGISAMFKNNVTLNKFINDKEYDESKIKCLQFVRNVDTSLDNLHNKFVNNSLCITDVVIDNFVIDILFHCMEYSNSIGKCKLYGEDFIKEKYDELIKKYNYNLIDVYTEFKNKYDIQVANKHINFYEIMTDGEYQEFLKIHFDTLKNISHIIKRLDKVNIDRFMKKCKISDSKFEMYRTFRNILLLSMY
jgi:hypothetical protein